MPDHAKQNRDPTSEKRWVRRRRVLKATAVGGIVGLAGYQGKEDSNQSVPTEGGREKVQSDGEFVKNEISFVSPTRDFSSTRFEMARILTNQWEEELGLDLDFQPIQFSNLIERIHGPGRDLELGVMWSTARPEKTDPHRNLAARFNSENTEDGGQNASEYENPEYDELIEQEMAETDQEKRQELIYEMQEILARDQPQLFLFHQNSLAGANTQQFSNWQGVPALQAMWWNVFSIGNLEANTDNRTAIWGTGQNPTTLNPMGVDSGNANIAIAMAYDRLVRIGLDAEPKPWAARDWEWKDSTTLEMSLREDLTFHDGEPFTAEDVKFTMEYYLEWTVPYMKSYYAQVDSVDTLDDYTVQFNLSAPNVSFLSIGLAQLYILPKHIWDGVAEEAGVEHPRNWDNSPYIGSGPLRVREFDPENRVLYEVHEDDPRTEEWDVEELAWKVYGSQAAAVGDLQSNRISFVQALHPNNYQQLTGSPGVKAVNERAHGYTRVELHNKTAPTSDKVFRQALAHATNKDDIINVVFDGNADKATSPVAPVLEFWHNPDTPSYEGGVSKAREMLEDARYSWDDDGNLLLPLDRFSDQELENGDYL